MSQSVFGKDFLWGVATAAYQIEGAAREGNRGASIWDTFSHTPGKTYEGHTGDVACDHYHRFKEDVAIMAEIGVRAYRFSIAWPRIIPDGVGPTNPAGVDFYSRLVDELLAHDITPVATLYHWDLPQRLEDRGGWQSRETADRFAEYAARVVELLGDRIGTWITINEPEVISICGYGDGSHAPGMKDPQAVLTVSHVLNLAHAKAIPAMRAADPTGRAKMGITLSLKRVYPADPDSETDRAAARFAEGLNMFLEPTFKKRYTAEALAHYGERKLLSLMEAGDADIFSPEIDFLGVNNYSRLIVRGTDPANAAKADCVRPADSVYTEMDWEVAPTGLRDLLISVHQRYRPKAIMVTENGAAFADTVSPEGRVHDEERVAYLREYIAAAGEAVAAGVPLTGYFVWSLLDNLEWHFGYSKRFGIVYVDYRTQRRILKDSALWYKDWLAAGRGC